MTTESQTAPESASGLPGAGGRSLIAGGRRWRLPIAYGSIASTALALDLALILGSATFAEAIYHNIPEEFAGEYSHTLAAAIFVAILFVAAMRAQKLYSPTRLMVWDDQARSVLGAWCGAFLILASGVFSWGVSHDLSRGDVLLFWATGVVALLGHRAAWRFALPRALQSGALPPPDSRLLDQVYPLRGGSVHVLGVKSNTRWRHDGAAATAHCQHSLGAARTSGGPI